MPPFDSAQRQMVDLFRTLIKKDDSPEQVGMGDNLWSNNRMKPGPQGTGLEREGREKLQYGDFLMSVSGDVGPNGRMTWMD